MIKKIKCCLAKLLKKDHWHDYELEIEVESARDSTMLNYVEVCKVCGEVKIGTKPNLRKLRPDL